MTEFFKTFRHSELSKNTYLLTNLWHDPLFIMGTMFLISTMSFASDLSIRGLPPGHVQNYVVYTSRRIQEYRILLYNSPLGF